jgi:hypothetical protein
MIVHWIIHRCRANLILLSRIHDRCAHPFVGPPAPFVGPPDTLPPKKALNNSKFVTPVKTRIQ